jgi:hypothetical protein
MVVLLAGCSREAPLIQTARHDFRTVALEFTTALTERDYEKAYSLTSMGYRQKISMDQMREAFEAIVPTDWKFVGPVEVGETMTDWQLPPKEPSDFGWVYVSIGGEIYSEAVIVIVTLEDGTPRIREVEFGRP